MWQWDIFGQFLYTVKKAWILVQPMVLHYNLDFLGTFYESEQASSESRVQSGSIYENNPEIKSNGVLLTNLHSLSWLCLAKLQKDYFLPHDA